MQTMNLMEAVEYWVKAGGQIFVSRYTAGEYLVLPQGSPDVDGYQKIQRSPSASLSFTSAVIQRGPIA